MYKEEIEKYLKQHGHSSIDLKAVLFDMDGVLFNSMPNHAYSWHKVMERMGFGLSEEEAYMHEGRTGADTINIISRRERGSMPPMRKSKPSMPPKVKNSTSFLPPNGCREHSKFCRK